MKLLGTFLFFCLIASANYDGMVAVATDAGATSVTLTNAGTLGGTTVIPIENPGGAWARVGVVLSQTAVGPTASTTYTTCANPCGVTLNQQWGQTYKWYVKLNSSGNPTSPFTATAIQQAYLGNLCGGMGTIGQVVGATDTTAPMPMPIKAIGHDCYVTPPKQFPLASGHPSTGLRLWLRGHNLWYTSNVRADGKISVRINGGSWIALTAANYTEIDEMKYYGGAGSFPRVRELTVAIPDGTISGGDTTVLIQFRFNGTEGNTSGSRILGLNIIGADKTVTSFDVASNIATAHVSSHGYSTNDTVLITNAPGMYSRYSGARVITGTATNTFTFAPCGTSLTASWGCTSPDVTGAAPPICRGAFCTGPSTQIVTHVAKCLIPASAFVALTSDTSAPAGGDAAKGKCLFTTGNESCTTGQHDQLVNPVAPYVSDTLHNGVCASCHFDQGATAGLGAGSDLAIYNFDNYEIERRSEFHGLSEQHGIHIAAYIRSLSLGTTHGRPWNPPFQPTPGLAAASTSTPDAISGGGIDSVLLDGYASHWEYLAPGGVTTSFAYDQRIEPRDLPIPYQLPDIMQWWPIMFPGDYYLSGSDFLSSSCYTSYKSIRDNLTPNNFSSFQSNNYGYFYNNCGTGSGYIETSGTIGDSAAAGNIAPSQFPQRRFAIQQWSSQKKFEIAVEKQTFQMAGLTTQAFHGGNATPSPNWPIAQGMPDASGTTDNVIFNVGMHRITMRNGLYNINDITATGGCTYQYQSNIWYMLQVIINAGNGWDTPQAPIDNAYYNAFLKSINICRPNGYVGYLHPVIFSAQSGNVNTEWFRHGGGGSTGLDWTPVWSLSFPYSASPAFWWFTTSEWTNNVINPFLDIANSILGAKTADYWSTTLTNDNGGCCDAHLTWSLSSGSPGPASAYLLPIFKVGGANSTKLSTFKSWADSLTTGGRYFTGHNFTTDQNAATGGDGSGPSGSLATPQPVSGNLITFTTCPSDVGATEAYLVYSSGAEAPEYLRGFGPGTCTAGNPGTMTFYNTTAHTGTPILIYGCSVTDAALQPNSVDGGFPAWWKCSNMF